MGGEGRGGKEGQRQGGKENQGKGGICGIGYVLPCHLYELIHDRAGRIIRG